MKKALRRLAVVPVVALTAAAVVVLASHGAETIAADEGMISGGTDVQSPDKRERVARFIAPSLERDPATIEAALRHLQERSGQGVYVEVRQAGYARPAVVLQSEETAVAALHVNGRMDVDLSGSDGEDGALAVFWVQAGTLAEYPVTVPTSVTHVTVVIDGREVARARPFDHAAGRVVIR